MTVIEPGMPPLETVTDSNGSYYLDSLPPGEFTATFAAAGYQSQSQTGQLLAGDAVQISATLERSLLLSAMAALPDAGAFLGYAQWTPLPDGGHQPGNQLFYLDPSSFLSLTKGDKDAGESIATRSVWSTGRGLRFLGFDREGGGVAERVDASNAVEIAFVDHEAVSGLTLAVGTSSIVLIGDSIFFGTPAAALGPPPVSEEETDWSSFGRGDLAPTPLEQSLGDRPPPVALSDRMAGWVVGNAGYDTPVLFAPEISVPLDEVCTEGMTPLSASIDGDRLALVVYPKADLVTRSGGQATSGPCMQSAVTQVFLAGSQVMQIADDSFDGTGSSVYPLSDSEYAGEVINPDGSEHLLVHESVNGSWRSIWDEVVDGWVPLHGSSLLAAARVDGGLGLEVIGGESGASMASKTSGSTAAIPFAHEWTEPVIFSPDNRYVVFAGIASLFDLAQQVEIPLTLTPVLVQFNRLETIALLVDTGGQMAIVPLGGGLPGNPEGTPLEGVAIAASFTADEDAVVYLGTDPMGVTGLFVEPIPNN